MIKIPSFNQIWNQSKNTFKRFPIAVTSALIGTGIAVYGIEDGSNKDWILRALFTASLSTFFFTVLALGCEVTSKNKRSILMLIGALLIGFYYWHFPENTNNAGDKWWMRHIFLCLGSLVALTWIPYWKHKTTNEIIWEWNRKLIMNAVVTIFFAIILFAGISAAFFAIESLFSVSFGGDIYFQVWVSIVGGFGPLFFLTHLPKTPQKLKIPKPIPAFMNVFTKYILTPLAIGYFVILYAYTFKVLFTWEWPKNVLGWLVICFSAVAIFTYFLWTPFLKPAFEKYRRIFWFALLPQIFLLFIAISWRIQAYSWTENRYFVVILGLWLLGISLYFLICKKATFKIAFMALTTVIFVSQIGPLSGYSIGENAQKTRLLQLLTTSQILQNGKIIPTKIKLDKETRYEISDIADYLTRRHGKEVIKEIFPLIVAKIEKEDKASKYTLPREITKALGFDFVSDWERRDKVENTHFNFNTKWNAPRNISGYDWYISVNRYEEPTLTIEGKKLKIHLDNKELLIRITENAMVFESINLKSFFEDLVSNRSINQNQDLNSEKLAYKYESEKLKAKIFFNHISGTDEKISSFDAQMYLRLK